MDKEALMSKFKDAIGEDKSEDTSEPKEKETHKCPECGHEFE